MNRKQITYAITDLMDENCKKCKIIENIKGNDRNPYCNTKCDIGKQLQEYGNELNRIGGKERLDKQKEEIKLMIKEGFQPKEIAEKLNVKPQKVHNIKYNMKKEGEKVEQLKIETVPKAQYDARSNAYNELEESHEELKKKYDNINKKHQEAVAAFTKASAERDEWESLYNKTEEELQVRERMIDELKKQLQEPANDHMEQEYFKMKDKHDKLLEYITIQ